jgi:hypothetical protein
MKVRKGVVYGHQWYRTVTLQVLLALVALFSMVLASGAGWQWWC